MIASGGNRFDAEPDAPGWLMANLCHNHNLTDVVLAITTSTFLVGFYVDVVVFIY